MFPNLRSVARFGARDERGSTSSTNRDAYGENRYAIIGLARDRLFYVAYTMRGERIRIISARGFEPHEQRRYHEDTA
jgi:uncharacterized DUF497 family protein